MTPLNYLKVLFILCAYITFGENPENSVSSVKEQLVNSLFQCEWRQVPAWSAMPVARSSEVPITVIPFPPKKEETLLWESLPATMTSSNHLLGHSIRTRRYENVTGAMWQLPRNHNRQNRAYCGDLSRRVSNKYGKKGLDLYKSNSTVVKSSMFYVAQMHDVIIQEQGVVALQCKKKGTGIGYYQPIASCETIYRFIGRKFVQTCTRNLTRHGLSFTDLLEDPGKHGPTCFQQEVLDPGWANKRKKKDKAGNVLPPRPRVTRDVRLVKYDKVFMATAGWDHNYHHFLIDSLTRIVRHLPWLKANPDIRIHIRSFERANVRDAKMINAGRLLRSKFWDLIGIDQSRLISGHAAARTVWVPRDSKCNDPLQMSYEIRLLASVIKEAAHDRLEQAKIAGNIPGNPSPRRRLSRNTPGFVGDVPNIRQGKIKFRQKAKSKRKFNRKKRYSDDDYVDDDGLELKRVRRPARSPRKVDFGGVDTSSGDNAASNSGEEIPDVLLRALATNKPIILVQQRFCDDINDCQSSWRTWNNTMTDTVVSSFQHAFPDHLVLKASDNDTALTRCVWCQIILYQHASVLVGIHGAGLTNIMFMAPETVLVELTGEYDGRMAPVCGYHGPLAAIFGVHHYLWLWVWKVTMRHPPLYPTEGDFLTLSKEVKEFIATI